MCFSGTVATLSHEIEWLLNPAVRASPPAAGAPFAPWTAWYAAAREAYPAARILSIDHPEGPRWAARVTIAYTDEDWRYVYVDPYAATVSGSFSEFGVARFFRSFHKQFYIYPGSLPHGVYAVGPLGVVLLASLVTGFAFYRFRWRDLFMRGPWRSSRAFWSALHRATGMWTVPMAVLITTTGVWYFVERALEDADVALPADTVTSYPAPPAAPSLWPMPIEDVVALAERTVPGFRVSGISFSRDPAPLVTLQGQTDAWLVRDSANTVQIDPYVGRVERIGLATAQHPVARWAHTADPLHFGTFGGLATKIIWFAAGLFSSLAILLGVRVWYMRSMPSAGLASQSPSVWLSVSVTLLVLAVSIYGCIVNIGDALAHQPAARFEPLGTYEIGPLSVRLSAAAADGSLRVAGSVPYDEARSTVRDVSVWVAPDGSPLAVPERAVSVDAAWGGFDATLDLAGAAPESRLWLAVQDPAGSHAFAAIPIRGIYPETGTVPPSEVVPLYVWIVVAMFTGLVAIVCVGWSWWLQRSVAAASRAKVRAHRQLGSISVPPGSIA